MSAAAERFLAKPKRRTFCESALDTVLIHAPANLGDCRVKIDGSGLQQNLGEAPWVVRHNLTHGADPGDPGDSLVAFSWWDPPATHPPLVDLHVVVECFDLAARKGIVYRIPMQRAAPEKHPALMHQMHRAESEIKVYSAHGWHEKTVPSYAYVDLEQFASWVGSELESSIRITKRKHLREVAGVALLDGIRETLYSEDRISSFGVVKDGWQSGYSGASDRLGKVLAERGHDAYYNKHGGRAAFTAFWWSAGPSRVEALIRDGDLGMTLRGEWAIEPDRRWVSLLGAGMHRVGRIALAASSDAEHK